MARKRERPTAEKIARAKASRQAILAKYDGEVPSSLWIARTPPRQVLDPVVTKSELARQDLGGAFLDQGQLLLKTDRASMAIWKKGGRKGGLSIYPRNVVERAVAYYSSEGEVVLDPFAGHNSRMEAVWNTGRSYIGYDICRKFVEHNQQVAALLKKRSDASFLPKATTITLHEQSSEDMVEEDNSVDLILSCPPYWDLEHYDDHPAQVGEAKTYEGFLDGMQRIAKECLRVLKPDRFCLMTIADLRRKKQFYLTHADLWYRFCEAGFQGWDLVIMVWEYGSIRKQFATEVERDKILPKEHEYVLVFRKPK